MLNAYIAHILPRHFYCWLSYEMIRETWLLETSCAFKDMSQEQNAVTWTIKPVKPKLNKNGKYRTTSWCQDLYTRHAGSIGCAIWLVFRRSLVRSSIQFDPRYIHISFIEIWKWTILSLPLIQVGLLSVTVERMGTSYCLTTEETCPGTVELG